MTTFVLWRDTREQKPYTFFGIFTRDKARPAGMGDYGIDHPRAHEAVDRKELLDMAHWLVNSKHRRHQIAEAQRLGQQLHIVVECTEAEFWRNPYVRSHEENIRRILAGERMSRIKVHWAGSHAGGAAITRRILEDDYVRAKALDEHELLAAKGTGC